jgi:hypothetical protein
MSHSDIRFAADENIRVLVLQVGEKIQREDYRAIRRVLKRDYASEDFVVLDSGEYIFYRNLWRKGVVVFVEGIECSLY